MSKLDFDAAIVAARKIVAGEDVTASLATIAAQDFEPQMLAWMMIFETGRDLVAPTPDANEIWAAWLAYAQLYRTMFQDGEQRGARTTALLWALVEAGMLDWKGGKS